MEIKKIELKNISHYARGSEETPCYNATVYINGKKAVEVSNDGHGGSDRQHAWHENGFTLREINEWCVEKFGQSTWEYNGEKYSTDLDLEHYCHDELYKWLDTKALKRDLKKHYLFVEGTELKGYKKQANDTDTAFKQFFEKKHPNEKCLNFLPFDDALKLFKECA